MKLLALLLTALLWLSCVPALGATGYGPGTAAYQDRDRDEFVPGVQGLAGQPAKLPKQSVSGVVFEGSRERLTAADLVQKAGGWAAVENVAVVPPELLVGLAGVLPVDYTVEERVVARLYLDIAAAAKLSRPVNLGVSTRPDYTRGTLGIFQKFFEGNHAVACLGQQGSYGISVPVAISITQLGRVDLTKLMILVYDRPTNSYTRIPEYEISGGYLYFILTRGGDLVFTDSAQLAPK